MKRLVCDMERTCSSPVTHMDEKGFVYCAAHGNDRKYTMRCRKLAVWELERITAGLCISYERGRKPVEKGY